MNVGDIVRVKRSLLDEPENVFAYVYEFTDGKCFIITENGVDLGAFNQKEQERLLSYVCRSGMHYRYENVTKLLADWKDGIFLPVFNFVKK